MDYIATGSARRALLRSRPAWVMLVLLVGGGLSLYAWPYVVDDAFILARYAHRLASGRGYTFNDGPATDGVTGPLWLLPLVSSALLGGSAITASKLCGLSCTMASVWLVLRRSSGRARASYRLPLIALLLASSSALWIWAIGGLETGAATLCVTVLLLALPRTRALPIGVCGGALLWLRPELALLVAFALLVLLLRERRAFVNATSIVLASGLLLLSFRVLMFGHFMPMTAHAKPPLFAHGAAYVWHCASSVASLTLLPCLLAAWLVHAREERVLLFALVVHGCAVLLAGGDWMASARLFVPLIPVACTVAASGFELCLRRARCTLLCAFALLGVRVYAAGHELTRARASGLLRAQRLPALLSALEQARGPIALLDIGAIGYANDHTLIDLGGLTEPVIAYSAGGHVAKRIPSEWLKQRAPAAIVLHSAQRPRVDDAGFLRWFAGYPVERNVLGMPWVLRRYRVTNVIEYDRDYFYVLLAPDSRFHGPVKRYRPSVR